MLINEKMKLLINKFLYYIEVNESSFPVEQLLEYKDETIQSDLTNRSTKIKIDDFFYESDLLFEKDSIADYGITYTPSKIADLMAKLLLNDVTPESKIIDPAMGSGSLLYSCAKMLKDKFGLSYKYIVENNLYGIDLKDENIFISKLLLSYLVWEDSNELPNQFNFIVGDSLDFTTEKLLYNFQVEYFDYCILNPPYVRSKRLSTSVKEKIKTKFQSSNGVTELYIAFFELSLNMLSDKGQVCVIANNSFLTTNNGKRLRNLLEESTSFITLYDLSEEIIFNGTLTYPIIALMQSKTDKNKSKSVIRYHTGNFEEKQSHFLDENYLEQVKINDKWYLLTNIEVNIIKKIENVYEKKLDDLEYRNGIATLRNNIYSFEITQEDDEFYYFEANNEKIEKEITKPFVLPNKSNRKNLRIIYPYVKNAKDNTVSPLDENVFKDKYPYAYRYLYKNKDELNKRNSDLSNKYWYEYGRSQGIKHEGSRIYTPYMARRISAKTSIYNDELFAAGYAIFSNDEFLLSFIKKILESNLITYYIFKTSKPYSQRHFSTAKNVLKKISIPENYTNIKINNQIDIYSLYNLTSEEIDIIEAFILENNL